MCHKMIFINSCFEHPSLLCTNRDYFVTWNFDLQYFPNQTKVFFMDQRVEKNHYCPFQVELSSIWAGLSVIYMYIFVVGSQAWNDQHVMQQCFVKQLYNWSRKY